MAKKIFIALVLLLIFFVTTNSGKAGINEAFQTQGEGNMPLNEVAKEGNFQPLLSFPTINYAFILITMFAIDFLGVTFMVILIYGGYLWMTSHGNDQQYEKAKNLIKAAIIGLFIVAAAYAISSYIFGTISQNTLK